MYPKWVQRAPDIGPVLCVNEDEEKKLLADYAAAQALNEKAAAALASVGPDMGQINLTPSKPKK